MADPGTPPSSDEGLFPSLRLAGERLNAIPIKSREDLEVAITALRVLGGQPTPLEGGARAAPARLWTLEGSSREGTRLSSQASQPSASDVRIEQMVEGVRDLLDHPEQHARGEPARFVEAVRGQIAQKISELEERKEAEDRGVVALFDAIEIDGKPDLGGVPSQEKAAACRWWLQENVAKLESVTDIFLSNKELTIIPREIELFRGLQSLVLFNNRISTLEGVPLPTSLQRLDLSNNQISTLEGVSLPAGLQTLVLSNNQISTLEGAALPAGLQTLVLSNNQISTLEGVSLPTGLQRLGLSFNQISTLEGVPLPAGLQTLYLRNNRISTLEGVRLPAGLRSLDLSDNRISTLEGVPLPDGLQELVLSHNQISTLEGVPLPAGLRSLDLSNNQISTLEGVALPTGLQMLFLSNNQISTLEGVPLPTGLQYLNLSDNQLIALPESVLRLFSSCVVNVLGNPFSQYLDYFHISPKECTPELCEIFMQKSAEDIQALSEFFRKLDPLKYSLQERLALLKKIPSDPRVSSLTEQTLPWYLWLLQLTEEVPENCPLCNGFPWTCGEVDKMVETGTVVPAMRFYDAEQVGRSEDFSQTPLNGIPTEVLIRFLGSKPFAQTKRWLETTIETSSGPQTRTQTMSATQRETILRRFRGDDPQALTVPEWRTALGATEEEVRRICAQEEPPPSEGAEQYQRELPETFDPENPTSLLDIFKDRRSLVQGLINAKTESLCGQRTFLTWKNALAGASACVAQDLPPLHVTSNGQPYAIYPRGVFNELTFGVAAVSLRRRLLVLKQTNPEEFARLEKGADASEFQTDEGVELELELRRISSRYPVTLMGGAFRQTLQDSYRQESRAMPRTDDTDTAPFKSSCLFRVLFKLAPSLSIRKEGNGVYIEDASKPLFYINSLEKVELRPEDNPGIVDLEAYAADYPHHTITPITPAHADEKKFYEFVEAMKKLQPSQVQEILDACDRVAASDMDEYLPSRDYFEALNLPPDIAEAAQAIVPIAEKYVGFMSTGSHAREPSGTYQLSNDPEEFCSKGEVPMWLPQTNFSGAVCASFIPHNPDRHDGNCGVNSFLLGLYGPAAYEGQPPQRNLFSDIQKFRSDVVSYAREHKEELTEEFGKGAIDGIIGGYASPTMWTGAEVWNIAAQVYGREVRLLSEETHRGVFRRENFTIVPFDEDVFLPKGELKGPPIHLVFFGRVHYANLEPKPAPASGSDARS